MKMKKRILSLVLAVMLVVAMAVPASAQTIQTGGTYDGCTYAISADVSLGAYYTVMEYQHSVSGDYTDYIFQASAYAYVYHLYDGSYRGYPKNSFANHRIVSVDEEFPWPEQVQKVSFTYRINSKDCYSIYELMSG